MEPTTPLPSPSPRLVSIPQIEANETLDRLLLFVTIEASELIQFRVENKEARYATLTVVWGVINKMIGEEQVKSLSLSSPAGKTAYRTATHWMGVLWATMRTEEADNDN